MNNIQDIVRQLLAIDRLGQEGLAAELDVKQPTVSRWLNGADPRGTTRDKILALAKAKGLIATVPERPARTVSASRFILVPVLSWVSAGKLAESGVDTPIQDVPKIAIADLGEGDFFALKVSGSSMDRISPDKSLIVVNRAERALHEGRPYVFAVRGESTYKLWRAAPPRLEPYSTDPSNGPIFLDKRQGMIVVGRVRRSILDL